jgi:hypothetical protein
MLEKQIEKRVCEYAKEMGMLVYKFTSPGRVGVPDRMFVCPKGMVFFIEFKRPGAEPTPPQIREHERLEAHGLNVFVIDDVTKGKLIVDIMWGKSRAIA